MIFLTLGTQLPFDRLTKAVDMAARDLDEPVFGQIGETDYIPQHFEYVARLAPGAFKEHFTKARVVVGHAGIGTVLAGYQARKPLVLMARLSSQGEHRNDHQLATVDQIRAFEGVHIANNAEDIQALLTQPSLTPMSPKHSEARARLIGCLRNEIFTDHGDLQT